MCRKVLIGSDTIVICKVLHCLWSLDTKELFISWFPWFPFPLLPLSISQAARRGYCASLCDCVCVCLCLYIHLIHVHILTRLRSWEQHELQLVARSDRGGFFEMCKSGTNHLIWVMCIPSCNPCFSASKHISGPHVDCALRCLSNAMT